MTISTQLLLGHFRSQCLESIQMHRANLQFLACLESLILAQPAFGNFRYAPIAFAFLLWLLSVIWLQS